MSDSRRHEDSRLKALADMLRSEESEQRALDQLAEGELPEADLRALRARAASDPQLATALEAYAPLDVEVRARIRALFVARAATAATAQPQAPRTRRARGWAAAAALAAAAGAMVFIGVRDREPSALPEYALSVRAATAVRDAPALEAKLASGTPVVTAPNTQLQLWLRPSRASHAGVTARVFLRRGERCEAWPATATAGASGAIHLELTSLEARLPPSAALVVVLGDADLVASRAAELACGQAAAGPRWRRWILPLRTRP